VVEGKIEIEQILEERVESREHDMNFRSMSTVCLEKRVHEYKGANP
jgi:hypothetical protein